MENELQEGVMSFEDLMSESGSLDIPNVTEPVKQDPEGGATPEEVELEVEPVEGVDPEDTPKEEPEEDPIKEEEEPKVEPTNLNNSLTQLSKKFIESGKWEDVVVEIDGEEIQLSELDELDEETFLEIQEAQESLKEESRADKFIPKEGLNDVSLKLIELQRNGGDMSEAFKIYDEYVNPLEGLDLSNEKIQEQLVRRNLSRKVEDPEIVEMTINKYKKDLVLDQKANEVVNLTKDAFGKYMEQKNQEAQTKKQQEAEAHREYMKSLEEEYKAVELKPELKKQVLSLANKNDKGEYEAVEAVREQLKDPKLAQELLLFIGNRDAYKKSLGAQTKTKQNIETFKKIKLVKDKQKKQSGGSSKDDGSGIPFDFVEVDKL